MIIDGWETNEAGQHRHAWCGWLHPEGAGRDRQPTLWHWYDRRGRYRATFSTLAEAKMMARKLSGAQRESEL